MRIVVQDLPDAPTRLTRAARVAASRRLEAAGCELAISAAADLGEPAGPGTIPARLTCAPKAWWDWDQGIEAATIDELVTVIDGGVEVGLVTMLFGGEPRTWRAAVEERLGSPASLDDRFWLFGAGQVGRQVAVLAASLGKPPEGFVDNDARLQGAVIDGLPVRLPAAVDSARDRVVLCTGGHHARLRAQLADGGMSGVLHLSEYMFLLGSPIEPERGYAEGMWQDRFRYLGLLGRLADAASRRTLEGVLAHRHSFAGEPLLRIATGDQWFIPEVFAPSRDHVYVDGGAYDGDTARAFLDHNGGSCAALHLFEPDGALCARAKARLSGTPAVFIHQAGLSDHTGDAAFGRTGGMDGALSEAGCERVRVEAIDDTVHSPVTYLKLDVEGAELAALDGARRSVLGGRPTIAVAAYHRSRDLWRLPAWIDALRAGYSLRLRHHTELAFETVAYGSPPAAHRR